MLRLLGLEPSDRILVATVLISPIVLPHAQRAASEMCCSSVYAQPAPEAAKAQQPPAQVTAADVQQVCVWFLRSGGSVDLPGGRPAAIPASVASPRFVCRNLLARHVMCDWGGHEAPRWTQGPTGRSTHPPLDPTLRCRCTPRSSTA